MTETPDVHDKSFEELKGIYRFMSNMKIIIPNRLCMWEKIKEEVRYKIKLQLKEPGEYYRGEQYENIRYGVLIKKGGLIVKTPYNEIFVEPYDDMGKKFNLKLIKKIKDGKTYYPGGEFAEHTENGTNIIKTYGSYEDRYTLEVIDEKNIMSGMEVSAFIIEDIEKLCIDLNKELGIIGKLDRGAGKLVAYTSGIILSSSIMAGIMVVSLGTFIGIGHIYQTTTKNISEWKNKKNQEEKEEQRQKKEMEIYQNKLNEFIEIRDFCKLEIPGATEDEIVQCTNTIEREGKEKKLMELRQKYKAACLESSIKLDYCDQYKKPSLHAPRL